MLKRIWAKKQIRIAVIVLAVLSAFPLINRLVPFRALDEFRQQEYSCRIYDRKDRLIQVTALSSGGRREYTAYKDIPEAVRDAFIKSEDRRFFFHHGVDYLSLASAVFQYVRAGEAVRGGSTITMQLAKMISGNREVTVRRKLHDIVTAWRIEAKLSKKEILELYLNSVYLGNGATGITSGARTYFGRNLSQLTDAQIELLAIIPRNPEYYNPVKGSGNFSRFSEDVQRAAEAVSERGTTHYELVMPHFVNYLKSEAAGLLDAQGRLPYELHTTTDLEVYYLAYSSLADGLEQAGEARIANGALLVLDNSDGSVLAWIGNADFFDEEHSGQVDGVLVRNQPGSSMKPFLYALGIDEGIITPATVLADVPTEFGTDKLYIPENFNNRFNGPVRVRTALGSSLNVPAVSLLNELGTGKYLSKLYELGFESLKSGGAEADLGLALGAGEVRLSELVPAFTTFTRDGVYYPLKVVASDEKPAGRAIYDTDTARLMCSILSDKAARVLGFGYTQTFQTDYPSIFKTGTSNQYQDIVALGATTGYTIGVWMGNFSGQTVVGKTGSSLPAWVARNILDSLEHSRLGSPDMNFAEPGHWHLERICPLSGMKAGENCPNSISEYVRDGDVLETCSWHVKMGGETVIVYPAEYQSWVVQNGIQGYVEYSTSELTITSPKDGALFYYSALHQDSQAIPVEVMGGTSDTLSVTYDGKDYGTIERPFTFTLPVERGNHTLTVRSGNAERTLTFEVR